MKSCMIFISLAVLGSCSAFALQRENSNSLLVLENGLSKNVSISPKNFCSCGQQQSTRIVGGYDAKEKELPWRCHFWLREGSIICGCSIISNQWIMTAAHCLPGISQVEIYLGSHDRRSDSPAFQNWQKYSSDRIIVHPSYRRNAYPYDIALIRLNQQIQFSPTVQPVCLPWNDRTTNFQGNGVISGFGRQKSGSPNAANVLQKADVNIITWNSCKSSWGNLLKNDMICAKGNRKGICGGDSGGSLDSNRNGRYYAVGIAAWGDNCRYNKPDVFTRVTTYLDWIQSTTNEDFCRI